MQTFKPNKITNDFEEIAEKLKTARERKKLTLEKVTKELGIKNKYLKALENADFNKLPKGIYGKKFLKGYADFLNLNSGKMVEIFENQTKKTKEEKKVFSKKKIKKHNLIILPKIIQNILLVIFLIFCLTYLAVSLKRIILPPELIIIHPETDITIVENYIDVKGQTDEEAVITINNEIVLSERDGFFTKRINLKEGINTITIKSKKRFGKEKIITKQILVEKK